VDDTFSINPATGAASLAVPIFDASTDEVFSPELLLRYDSRWGNGPFGVGWRVPVPYISRKTEGGSPRYRDDADPDVFVSPETGELVPLLDRWAEHAKSPAIVDGAAYSVHGYLPRSEGPYTIIQRYLGEAGGETHWRTISARNITNVYGTTPQSRIADPADPSRVFAWLLDFSYDSSGRVIAYEYVAENGAGVEPSAGEQQRRVTANRYIKRVKYGFATPYDTSGGGALPTDWRFQLVFDYGEHCSRNTGLYAEANWPARLDPFSSYRAGFEVRTYRLCRRVLHFYREVEANGEGIGAPKLLGATNVEYAQTSAGSFIKSVARDAMPPLQLDYGEVVVDSATRSLNTGILGRASTEYRVPSTKSEAPNTRYSTPGTRYLEERESLLLAGGFGQRANKRAPRLISADHERAMYLADMSGDGLADLVSVRNGEVCYWPNLGRGRFGQKIVMEGAPTFDDPEQFDPKRVRMADIDGSGTSDLIYLGSEAVAFWFNQSGNGWSSPHELPPVLAAGGEAAQVSVLDLLGSGTACIAWRVPGQAQYIDLMGGQVPRLLVRVDDNSGTETRIRYGASCVYRSDARQYGPPACSAACPVQVVEGVERLDYVRNIRTAQTYEYHEGYIDADEGEFLGFGRVERWDAWWPLSGREQLARSHDDAERPGRTTRTITWYHNGTTPIRGPQARQVVGKDKVGESELPQIASMLETKAQRPLSEREMRDASIALKGCMARQEVYTVDEDETTLPQEITVYDYELRLVQPAGRNRHAVFGYEREGLAE
jgi:hypothetical protein